MTIMEILLLGSVGFLAYANGANDNFKGVATLFGSNTTSYRTALIWATFTTFAGSVAAPFLARALWVRFSGKGLVPDALIGSEPFLLAVALGAGLTVILASYLGFPISTTHALIGALLGSTWVAAGSKVQFAMLSKVFLLPLILGPVLSVLVGALLYLGFHWLRLRLGITKEWCICVGVEQRVIPVPQPSSVLAFESSLPTVIASAGEYSKCSQRYAGSFWGIGCQQAMDLAHLISAGAVSFARGLNDAPKIAALLTLLPGEGAPGTILGVALAMALGGIGSARKVAETMSHKITGLNHGQGFSANVATALLVTGASVLGLPVSTTHGSVGALFGVGLISRQANLPVVRNILLSWLVTLPCGALLSALVYALEALGR